MKRFFRPAYFFSTVPSWATVDPWAVSASKPHTVSQILDGKVYKSDKTVPVIDPINGETFMHVSHPSSNVELDKFI